MAYWNSRGLRGSQLEESLNMTNKIYLEQGLAVVQKIPTAIKPVELDPGKGTIKLAYFEEKSTVDYLGNIQGIPVCFDAKETSQKRLPIANIHSHQMDFMEAFEQQEGLSFLIVHFKFCDETFLLPFMTLKTYWDNAQNDGRKSIPYADFDQNLRIYPSHNILLHYLEAVNHYLNRKEEKNMKKIPSFTINHLELLRGIYLSRKDYCGDHCITTFDIRMKEPNREPVINIAELHALEHIGATYLRNDPVRSDEIVYFGPMGCRTGFYLLVKGELTPEDILPLIINLFTFIAAYDDEIPGATPRDCGNYLDMNLPMARYEAKKFLTEILENIQPENMVYPK